MPNRLAEESSPYLLQHQTNPVDWYPWGEEAFGKARAEGKPLFLSIGYSACHWCHVMEHESFESEMIAEQLNDGFVSVKVDREERPDLDQIYMNAVQMLTGHGGWPMSVFLDHEGRPFFGGTYWPPQRRMGMPGFPDVLAAVLDAWNNKREQLNEQAALLTEKLASPAAPPDDTEDPAYAIGPDLLTNAAGRLHAAFDHTNGGFGTAPKFPHPMDLQLLLRLWQRSGQRGLLDMVRLNLDKMAAGGIYDHLGGGFARYSVDAHWLVPHFEKMLYDNALLTATYVEAWQATGDDNYQRVARETLDYILRDMTDPAGGFYSTEDADSEGEEGKFYVWRPSEVAAVLGEERAERFNYVYDVSLGGNWEGKSILNLPKTIEQAAKLKGWDPAELTQELAESRQQLFEARKDRVPPGKDDKVLVSWNGLMIDAMARAATAFGDKKYLAGAQAAAEFILSQLTRDDGRLLHTWRHGTAKLDAYLDDYACLANALVTLYEASQDEKWIDHAVRLGETMLALFVDLIHKKVVGLFSEDVPTTDGVPDIPLCRKIYCGFFFTATDHEQLIARQKDLQDSSVPSGNAMAATVLLRLAKLTGRSDFFAAAESALRLGAALMRSHPTAAGQMLLALDFYLGPTHELVLVADARDGLDDVLAELGQRFIPRKVLATRPSNGDESSHLAELFAGKSAEGSATLYVCQDFACQAPVSGKAAIVESLDGLQD